MKELEINGYFTIVENEILDLLPLLKLTLHEIKIILAIVRLLNGFGKVQDRIPLSLLKKMTKIFKGDCSKTVKRLIGKKILYKSEGLIGINRDFRHWEGVSDSLTGKGLAIWLRWVSDSSKKGVSDSTPSKEKEKEIIQIKVLPKKITAKEREELIKGFKKLKEDLKKVPDRKK